MIKPIVLLVEPQLGQNIGKVARAMLNFNLTELRLINPRKGWLSKEARMLAAGADQILDNATCYDHFDDAIADLQRLYAASVRPRDIIKSVLTPHTMAEHVLQDVQRHLQVGLLFGPERTGLRNEHIIRADAVVTIPVNSSFGSLNLAQAVVVLVYEWYQALGKSSSHQPFNIQKRSESKKPEIASKQELMGFLRHLESELLNAGYFRAENKRPQMTQNLFNIFSRTDFTALEIRTLRGVVSTLVNPNGIYSKKNAVTDTEMD